MGGQAAVSLQALSELLEDLEGVPCIFFACQGPDAPFEPMATCRVCAAVQDLRKIIADAQEVPTMPSTETATVIGTEFYFVIQRPHIDSHDRFSWVDSSAKYYGIEGNDTAKTAALTKRDEMREIFGQENVRVVRRDVTITESPVE